MKGISDNSDCSKQVGVAVALDFLRCLGEERDCILVFLRMQALQPLAKTHVVEGVQVQLLDLVCLDVVFETVVVLFGDKVAVCSVKEYEVVDIVWRSFLRDLASALLS